MSILELKGSEIFEYSGNGTKYNQIILKVEDKTGLSPDLLNKYFRDSESGGAIQIVISKDFSESISDFKMSLKFAGFKSVTHLENENGIIIKGLNKSTNTENSKVADKWKIDETKESTETLNPSELINPNDYYEKFSKKSDCITRPKPCKNCNCGRANAQESVDVSSLPKSECGKCYLGDAFRCEGCPYRGLPAFEKDSKIKVDTVQDSKIEEESVTVTQNNKKVQIDL